MYHSRIDFIAVPTACVNNIQPMQVNYAQANLLQASPQYQWLDHAPVIAHLQYRDWHEADTVQRQPRLDREKLLRATKCDEESAALRQALQTWATSIETRNKFQALVMEHDLDGFWHLLNGKLKELTLHYFPSSPKPTPPVREETLRLRQLHLQQRRELIERVQQWNDTLSATQQIPDLEWAREILLRWRQHLQAVETDCQLHSARRTDYRTWVQTLSSELKEADCIHDTRTVWRLARKLAGTRIGTGGRFFQAAPATSPSTTDWQQHLARPGDEGGASAKQIWQGEREDFPRFVRARSLATCDTYIDLPAEQYAIIHHQADADWDLLLKALCRKGTLKALPFWSCPREAWRITLQVPEWTDILYSLIWMIRAMQRVPVECNISQGAPLPKHNGRPGCSGMRLLRLLGEVGKAWDGIALGEILQGLGSKLFWLCPWSQARGGDGHDQSSTVADDSSGH